MAGYAASVQSLQGCIFRLRESRPRIAVSIGQEKIRNTNKGKKALVGELRLQSVRLCRPTLRLLAMNESFKLFNATPNPSIEGTHKRLRLLRPPHVKR
jgi:hypothetical protein